MAEDRTPKWYRVAWGTINALPFAMTRGLRKPIGRYGLVSDETFGMSR
jgi:hypothetical protein